MIEGFTAPDLKQARAQGFQVALAVSLYGVSFGALSVALGFTLWQTMVLSLVMFSGASQFAFIGVVATGGLSAIPAAIATSGLLGARNSLYALTMSPIIGKGFFRRALAAHLTVDETTAVATAQTGRLASQHGFWATAFWLYVGWNVSTLAGALAGDALGDVKTWGTRCHRSSGISCPAVAQADLPRTRYCRDCSRRGDGGIVPGRPFGNPGAVCGGCRDCDWDVSPQGVAPCPRTG